ncbi:KAP family NTPase [Sphingomonas sp. PL-96]|uniref:KAP family P-loop NTPase fold protein n=1 Tax=Sphingomonas sp. PL-96 TaxID=2887201 RepID=UPI001E42C02C|nr:P-loop NTPase fold protein [Sphingomonas sp. PL-96]MCC2976230.1 KAP family NTPase [Sphingomonas sp. PL-96]
MRTPEEIWAGDLFGRRQEAEDLLSYLEVVTKRPSLREDNEGFVIAVDGNYGEGKTYFLKRFAENAHRSHPVAYIDAWHDDLSDDPLIALISTLERALEPYLDQTPQLKDRLAEFRRKAGAVVRLSSIGLLRKGAGLLLGAIAVDAIEEAVGETSKTAHELGMESAKNLGDTIVADAERGIADLSTGSLAQRIQNFRESEAAIHGMKAGLRAIVDTLAESPLPPPIIIVVDELDRCRPTYAIKFLEEVKHLFDVQGIVFVLGMNGDQLAHSVSATYGAGFASKAYLQRFLNRRYTLDPAPIQALVRHLFDALSLHRGRLHFPVSTSEESRGYGRADVRDMLTRYLEAYEVTARETFTIMETLETCFALTGTRRLYLGYLVPLIISHVRGHTGLLETSRKPNWHFRLHYSAGSDAVDRDIDGLAQDYENAVLMPRDQLIELMNNPSGNTYVHNEIGEDRFNYDAESLGNASMYKNLITKVSRFKSA